MSRKIIGLDNDDVLIDFNEGLRLFHNKTYGTNYKREDISAYEFTSVWGCSEQEARARVYEFYHSPHHATLRPVPGAVTAIHTLKRYASMPVVTSRPEETRTRTEQLVEKHFPGIITDFHFLGLYHNPENHSKCSKGDVCEQLGVDIFVEDMVANAIDISRRGIPVILLDAPWNQEPLPAGITRVSGWDEALEHLL